jgi:acyl-CoA hydrolase
MTSAPVSLEEAVAILQPTDTLGIPLGPGIPGGFMHALAARDDWQELRVAGALLTDLYEVLTKPGVSFWSAFYGPAERFLLASGADLHFVPGDFRRFGPILEQMAPRVMATVAAPPDADGYVSLSLHAGASIGEYHRAAADPDRVLLVEVSPNFPSTLGLLPKYPHRLHLDEIDVLVETDSSPVELEDAPPTEIELAIADNVMRFITDGCTIQTGIGGIPTAVAGVLANGPGGDYGVHSEMFTNGLMRLHKAGKVTNARKGEFVGHSITTFSAGSRELYDWLADEGRELVRFLPVEIVNSAEVIAQNHRFVSINGGISVDLYGQVVADTVAGAQFSGIGGHEDFFAGTGLELEDRSLLCLPSTATVGGEVLSRIVADFPAGTIVTTPRHQVDVVITEHGFAELRGHSVRERAEALASIAHPDFREDLVEAAERRGT